MKTFLLTFLLLACSSANATLISFSNTGNNAFTYSGVSFLNGATHIVGSGYKNVADATSTDFVAYNFGEASPSTFTWNSVGTFDLNSFKIAGAWGTQTLTISGYNGANLVGSLEYFVTTAASTFTANWLALTSFVIETGNDYIDTGVGSGKHWAMNDIVINDNTGPSQVPLPAALFMFAPALLGFLGLRRKAKNTVA